MRMQVLKQPDVFVFSLHTFDRSSHKLEANLLSKLETPRLDSLSGVAKGFDGPEEAK